MVNVSVYIRGQSYMTTDDQLLDLIYDEEFRELVEDALRRLRRSHSKYAHVPASDVKVHAACEYNLATGQWVLAAGCRGSTTEGMGKIYHSGQRVTVRELGESFFGRLAFRPEEMGSTQPSEESRVWIPPYAYVLSTGGGRTIIAAELWTQSLHPDRENH